MIFLGLAPVAILDIEPEPDACFGEEQDVKHKNIAIREKAKKDLPNCGIFFTRKGFDGSFKFKIE